MTHLELDHESAALRAMLCQDLPEIPCRFFYDDRGMELFDRITRLPEYYQTRTETSILARHARDIVRRSGARSICELGAGEAVKIRLLIDAGLELESLHSIELVDVNAEAVESSCALLRVDYPGLEFIGRVTDLTSDLSFIGHRRPQLVAYLAGSFGNFGHDQATAFLQRLARRMEPADALLLGVDLVKDRARLEAAYDDAQGVTAEFNRNALRHFNRETGSDFVPEHFEHVAFYDAEHERIEMRLRASRAARVSVPSLGLELDFELGDEIRTELSCKYTRSSLERLTAPVGLETQAWYVDEDELFALCLMRRAAP